jgi:probable O-glycosylation ligase (exosortase A-associated)
MSAAAVLVLLAVAAGSALAVRRPFAGLLVYLWLDFMRPHDFLPEIRAWRPMLVVGAVTLTATLWRERRRILTDWLPFAPLVAFVAAIALSVLGSTDRAASFATLIEAGKMLAVAWLLFVLVSSEGRLERVLWVVTLSLLVFACEAILQGVERGLIHEFDPKLVVRGPDGPFGDNNNIARVLALSVPLWWILASNQRRLAARIAAAGGAALAVAGIVFTFSRSGFLALVAGVSVASLSERPLWRALATPLLFSAALLILSPHPYQARILTIARPQAEGSVQGRVEIWKEGLRAAGEHPLTGQGPSTFRAGERRRTSHNILVELLAETGLLGLLAYLAVIAGAVVGLHRVRRSGAKTAEAARLRIASFGLEAALAAYLTASMALGAPLQSPPFVLIGLALALTWNRSRPLASPHSGRA